MSMVDGGEGGGRGEMRALVKPPPLGVRAPPVPRRRGGEGGCVQGGNALRRAEGERDGRPGARKKRESE